MQIIGQNGLNPTVASLILSLESVISVIAGGILLKESMSGKELVGCVLILGAIILAQIPVEKVTGEEIGIDATFYNFNRNFCMLIDTNAKFVIIA